MCGQSLEREERPPVRCEQDTDLLICLISGSKEDQMFCLEVECKMVKLTDMAVFVLLQVTCLGIFNFFFY